MDLAETKQRLEAADAQLANSPVAPFAEISTPHGKLRVLVTDRLRRRCRKSKLWGAPPMLATLKNAAYGFDESKPRSRGGVDGIFLVDRRFRPVNSMMTKLFAGFLDKPDALVEELVTWLDASPATWTPVRLVSHHLRLLGVFAKTATGVGQLALADYDDEKDH
jgi:hypothetical protein